jgi:cytochrome c553
MRKIFKWLGIVLGSLLGLTVLIGIGMYLSTDVRLNKAYSVQTETIPIPSDPASIERGKHWVSSECMHCHGSDLAGTIIFEDPKLGTIAASNLTPGIGGAGSEFTDADWVRAIRHGINPEGHSLIIMPASDFYYFSDGDLGDILAYLQSLPPVDKEWADPEFTPLAKILINAGAFGNIIEAENINQTTTRPSAPTTGATADYGEYLIEVSGCRTCHGENLAGGKDPNPAAPPVPGLVAGSEVAFWSEADFINTLRSGVTPSGHVLTDFMPWKDYGHMSDEQLEAIWLYLGSSPAK